LTIFTVVGVLVAPGRGRKPTLHRPVRLFTPAEGVLAVK
jgi:hypothetical protein